MAIKEFSKAQSDLRLSPNYRVGDFFIDDRLDDIKLDTKLLNALEGMIKRFGKIPCPATRHSYFRTKETNTACRGAKGSKHLLGIAADIYIDGISPQELAMEAERLKLGGIGVYARAKHIHIDTRSSKARWWLITSNSNTPGFGGVQVAFKQGHRSPAIQSIQMFLRDHGHPCGNIDGVFGIKTQYALKAWQAESALRADGVFGKKTNAAMRLFDW